MRFKSAVVLLAAFRGAHGFLGRTWRTMGAAGGSNGVSRNKARLPVMIRSMNLIQDANAVDDKKGSLSKMNLVSEAGLYLGDVVDRLPTLLVVADPAAVVDMAQSSRLPPTVEAEILNDLSHVTLDLFGFLNPEQFLLRLSTLVGRVLLMAADYDADKTISPDELLYQSGMLALSLKQFLSSLQQIRAGHNVLQGYPETSSTTSFRERVVYHMFCSPFGLSWLQFRTLVGSCIDWVEIQPNQTVSTVNQDGEQVAYWVYTGKVSIKHTLRSNSYEGAAVVQEMHRRRGRPIRIKENATTKGSMDEQKNTIIKDFGLIAGPDAMSALVDDIQAYKVGEAQENLQEGGDETLELVAGQQGATVMQINLAKLRTLMEDDEKLDKTIRNLIMLSIRNRMKAMTMSTLSPGDPKNETAAVALQSS